MDIMVCINKTQFPKKLRDEVWKGLWSLIQNSSSPESFQEKMKSIFTPTEIIMIEKRIAIPLLLKKGLTYREIGRLIDVSPTTINFIKHHFVKKPVVHRRYSAYPKKEFPRMGRSLKRIGSTIWK